MASQLKNILAFALVPPAVPTSLPHGLNINSLAVIPDVLLPSASGFTVTADAANVTVTNNGAAPANVDVYAEAWHSSERVFGAQPPPGAPALLGSLSPQPFSPDYSSGGALNPARTIVVALSGGHATTITAGLAQVAALIPAPSATDPAAVLVYPGIYSEAPMTVPGYVSLIGVGGKVSTFVDATVTTSPLFSGTSDALLAGLTLRGASGAGGSGVYTNSPGSFTLQGIEVQDCTTAFLCSGAGVRLVGSDCTAFRAFGATLDTGFRAELGASLTISAARAIGLVPAPITKGFDCDDANSQILVQAATAVNCTDALIVGNNGTLEAINTFISRAGNAMHVLADGTMRAIAVDVKDSISWDLLVDAASSAFRGAANATRVDKISVAAGASMVSEGISDLEGDLAMVVLGELQVGSPENPTESVFGEGDSNVRGMLVFRNTNLEAGAWSDITAQMASASASTADAFPGVGAGNALYVGNDDPRKFPGAKINTTAAIVLGAGSLIWEFWNGATWVAFNLMATDSVLPYDAHAQDVFGRIANEQVRWDDSEFTGWATKSLDGSAAAYWIRARVAVGITTSPTLQQIKVGTNRTEINADGVVEHYGKGELIKELVWHQRLVNDLSGSASGNATINASANIGLDLTDNVFANNAVDGVGGIIEIPAGIDTSRPLSLLIGWIPKATGGDVEFSTRSAPVKLGDVLDGTLPDVLQDKIVTAPAVDTLIETVFQFDISELEPHEFVAFSLFRDATGGNPDDTLAGSINIVLVAVGGTFWR